MEYTIVTASGHTALIAKINEMIEKGWEPIGGHTWFHFGVRGRTSYEHFCSQAMVLRDD